MRYGNVRGLLVKQFAGARLKKEKRVLQTRNVLVIGAALAAQFAFVAGAQAQTACQWYAATALKQQQENERLKCNFTGDNWHADVGRHLAWCKRVSPDQWKAAAQERDRLLENCAKR
jgi:hypothetical protein